jgi:hypothetical protein
MRRVRIAVVVLITVSRVLFRVIAMRLLWTIFASCVLVGTFSTLRILR